MALPVRYRHSRGTPARWPSLGFLAVMTMALLFASGPLAAQAVPAPLYTDDPVVRAGDVLRISVWPEQTLSGEFPVEESGFIHLPGLPALQVAGMPLSRLREEIRREYAVTMQNPTVTITPLFRVSVLGEVPRPGLYVIDPTHTLFEVISLAGGFTPDAEQRRVRIIRDGQVHEYDVERALSAGGGTAGTGLRSGDRIVVPRSSRWTGDRIRTILFGLQSIVVIATLVDRFRN